MKMIKVNSSNIESIGYEGNDLIVQFKTGNIYKYFNVEKTLYESLLNSDSKGQFLNSFIKGNYKYSRLYLVEDLKIN